MSRDDTPPVVLVVENNDDDFEASEVAFRQRQDTPIKVVRCTSGRDALDYLLAEGPHAPPNDGVRPGFILLDLNLPGMSGREVLIQIKKNPALRIIPVIIMTSSTDQRDVDECYRHGANAYVKKPMDLKEFFKVIFYLQQFLFDVAILPVAD
ncbi:MULTISPECIES: response regulator [unclassified Roseovarius]|uniref:response regulator n=1 Tax=unclassified Roseovarius TaxID=2614913 RepID=UPI00273F0D82|nr:MULTISPECIES: response regulator [unclassified Roseovarius]